MFWPSPAWDEVTYWALDLETGGLDPRHDPIIALGMVPVRGGTIRLGEAYETLVKPTARTISVESVRAHQLVPRDVSDAPSLFDAMAEIHRRLEGDAVLLVHQAAIDVRFLRQAHRDLSLHWPRPRVVDTVDLIVRVAKKARFIDPDAQQEEPVLNLSEARRKHSLPDYGAHDALTDAIATAELFLVLRRSLRATRLRELL